MLDVIMSYKIIFRYSVFFMSHSSLSVSKLCKRRMSRCKWNDWSQSSLLLLLNCRCTAFYRITGPLPISLSVADIVSLSRLSMSPAKEST
jgi:hypothetical protein